MTTIDNKDACFDEVMVRYFTDERPGPFLMRFPWPTIKARGPFRMVCGDIEVHLRWIPRGQAATNDGPGDAPALGGRD